MWCWWREVVNCKLRAYLRSLIGEEARKGVDEPFKDKMRLFVASLRAQQAEDRE